MHEHAIGFTGGRKPPTPKIKPASVAQGTRLCIRSGNNSVASGANSNPAEMLDHAVNESAGCTDERYATACGERQCRIRHELRMPLTDAVIGLLRLQVSVGLTTVVYF